MIFLFIFSVLIASFSQIILKKGSNKKRIYFNLFTIIGYIFLMISTILTSISYKKINLSTGVVIESLSYVFVPILGYIFYKEKINNKTIISIILIILGTIIFNL